MPARRHLLVAGNWKMHKTASEAAALAAAIHADLPSPREGVEVAVFPAFPAIAAVAVALKGSGVVVGAQNLHPAREGAFTGEVSTAMLLEAGATAVLLGHSERRHLFHEDDAFVREKLAAALEAGLRPVLCVGETLEERDSDRTEEVLKRQVLGALEGFSAPQADEIVLAYEPVWAIGTGRTATPEQAAEAHVFVRSLLGELWGEAAAESTRILYGGSVKPSNAEGLLSSPAIDGALVGGASLSAESFGGIVRAALRAFRTGIN